MLCFISTWYGYLSLYSWSTRLALYVYYTPYSQRFSTGQLDKSQQKGTDNQTSHHPDSPVCWKTFSPPLISAGARDHLLPYQALFARIYNMALQRGPTTWSAMLLLFLVTHHPPQHLLLSHSPLSLSTCLFTHPISHPFMFTSFHVYTFIMFTFFRLLVYIC